jgi:hypothetical protein
VNALYRVRRWAERKKRWEEARNGYLHASDLELIVGNSFNIMKSTTRLTHLYGTAAEKWIDWKEILFWAFILSVGPAVISHVAPMLALYFWEFLIVFIAYAD